jgi:hypothetical protein
MAKFSSKPGKSFPERVKLPKVLLSSFQRLSKDRREWAGGMDFEKGKKRTHLKRVLLYRGREGWVPAKIIKKFANDVEVYFHTHPVEYGMDWEWSIT